MKPKVAIVPRWESPAKKQLRFKIRLMERQITRGISDRRERERTETLLADARAELSRL